MVKKHGIQGDLARGELEPGAHPASWLNPEGDLGGQGQGARDGAGRWMRPEAMTQGLRRQAGAAPPWCTCCLLESFPGVPPPERVV